MTRKELLEAAIKTVTEDRQDQYGSPERSLEAIACFWTTYICAANPGADIIVSGRDVAAMMSLLKLPGPRRGRQSWTTGLILPGMRPAAQSWTALWNE